MIDLLLDPEKALDAINKAVNLVKKAASTAQNAQSLAPVLGKLFEAKGQAYATMQAAKSGKLGKSAFGLAAEIEMAIYEAERQEEHIKNTVFYPNHMDLWMKIKATEANIKKGQLAALKQAKLDAKRKADKDKEMMEITLVVVLSIVLLGLMLWGGWYMLMHCRGGCRF